LPILQRYFFREMALNFLGVTGALTAILAIYQLGAVLKRAADYQYPRELVLRLFALGAAENFSLLLPLGVLLGIVLALGRLYHESEMTAARACGYVRGRAWLPAILLAVPIALLSAWLNLEYAPHAAGRRAALTAEAVRAGLAVPIAAGRFRSFDGGRTVVYARAADSTGQMQKVFIKQTAGAEVIATVAQRAHREIGPDGFSQTIVLLDGERSEGVPGSAHYRFLKFTELRVPLTLPAPAARAQRLDERSSEELLASDDRRWQAELQWRLGFPVMVLVGAACAMTLGRLRPRQGRYERVWKAVLVFAIYGNLATAARTWYEHGLTPAPLGIWWVHLPFIVMCLWLARKSL
jgi:lipopolysaccharide export system permease protein